MAKDKLSLSVNDNEIGPAPSPQKEPRQKKTAKKDGPNLWQRFKRYIREIISELKKVDWPPFKRSKNNPGVIANLGIVLVVVVIFLVVITAFDAGLGALLRLLTRID
ncbi:MAG: preprotein translocase subunit SecE [Clostridia bacterium]|nr:preprotein translocase subunit SecE [Clostridia bacterium]